VLDWLKEDPNLRIKELTRRLKAEYKVTVPYRRMYKGKNLAMDKLFGHWDKSFENLFRLKAQIEESSPGSSFVIDHHTINNKIRFRRLFFALKPCVDGFLRACRPYLAVDSTFLNGRFRGQLCIACAVDGHNWMYPVAVGVIDSEDCDNWLWFMSRLRDVIGFPDGLCFHTDCGQAVMSGVSEVFPGVEHRECMYHLVLRSCTCRVWQGTGIPCKYAIAYITSIPGARLEDFVSDYYSVHNFKLAYQGSIPCIPDKSMWPTSNHGFFMHPPLLRATAGGRRKNRMKGTFEGGSSQKDRRHQCPICYQKGHHWETCKNGKPEDIAAMIAER